jgi:hypothetical protein
MKSLWLKLERAKPKTPEHDTLMKQMRAEVDAYKALIDEEKRPLRKREDSK